MAGPHSDECFEDEELTDTEDLASSEEEERTPMRELAEVIFGLRGGAPFLRVEVHMPHVGLAVVLPLSGGLLSLGLIGISISYALLSWWAG